MRCRMSGNATSDFTLGSQSSFSTARTASSPCSAGCARDQRAALAWAELLTRLADRSVPDEAHEAVCKHFSQDEVIALSVAMVSNVRYARLPRIGLHSVRGVLGLVVNLTILGFAIWARDLFFFPLGIAYLSYGLARAAVVGFLEKNDDLDPEQPEGGSVVLHQVDSGNRLRRREPGARDG